MIKFHDSLKKKNVPFKPLVKGKVRMYNCGPTVYGDVHIGNLRSFLFADVLRRFLEYKGYDVEQIMNITDVGHMLADADVGEDKMEVAAKAQGKTPEEVAEHYTARFFRDIDRANVRRATSYPKASAHVEDMIALIGKLLENGKAYKVEHDGGVSVYYDVTAFRGYGKLSGNTLEGLTAGARVEVRDEKRHPGDFALWIHNPKHLMQWEAPWGKGYPGWHIECSAMAMKYLGPTLDIHTGGEDNKFPHHECEIAQSEGATGKPFAKVWMHVTHLLVDGEKMSKSKGNFHTLSDLVDKGHSARAIRYLLISAHYRQSLNFTMDGITAAAASLARLDDFMDAVGRVQPANDGKKATKAKAAHKAFDAALENDLNVSEALAAVFAYVKEGNELRAADALTGNEKTDALAFMTAVGDVLGFSFGRSVTEADIPESIMTLVRKRDEARKEKRFAESDRLRDELLEKGYMIEDSPDGTLVKRA
jgi:cysteinyl-tRNA synthetase